jgi:molybdate-binding protein/DNA-binding transcriptional regulator YhcF (GntR family)
MLDIKLTKGQPEYAQIAEQVRLAIARGTLHPGDRLESVRELAARLGVNASTVARAYRELEQAGVIETHGRRGTLVAARGDAIGLRAVRNARLRSLAERAVVEALAQGFAPEEIEAAFGLQLAAWREQMARPASRPAAESADRLCRFAGSHDLALEALWAHARREHSEVSFTANYVGSLDGLLALLHGEVALAGAHILDEETGEYNLPILRRLFPGGQVRTVTLAEREQGLIVASGNPKRIGSCADLARDDVRFVNRQPGSGTRTLLELHLRRAGIAVASVAGFDRVVETHLAVASAVAEGSAKGGADAGLGVYAAARAFGLDFVPVAKERYDLVLLSADRRRPPINWLLDMVASHDFRAVVAELGGYDTAKTGQEHIVV